MNGIQVYSLTERYDMDVDVLELPFDTSPVMGCMVCENADTMCSECVLEREWQVTSLGPWERDHAENRVRFGLGTILSHIYSPGEVVEQSEWIGSITRQIDGGIRKEFKAPIVDISDRLFTESDYLDIPQGYGICTDCNYQINLHIPCPNCM